MRIAKFNFFNIFFIWTNYKHAYLCIVIIRISAMENQQPLNEPAEEKLSLIHI